MSFKGSAAIEKGAEGIGGRGAKVVHLGPQTDVFVLAEVAKWDMGQRGRVRGVRRPNLSGLVDCRQRELLILSCLRMDIGR